MVSASAEACFPRAAAVAASPDGTHIYVTNNMHQGTVSVITRP